MSLSSTAAIDIAFSSISSPKRFSEPPSRTASDILRKYGLSAPPAGKDRYYTTCPNCSPGRSRAHQKARCLGITIDTEGVHFGCNHCGWRGGGYFSGKANGYDRASPFTAIYDYSDENGELLFQVCRRADKQFPQRRPDGKGGWIWGVANVRRVLYRLPELIEAISTERIVLIVEGEKDVENLRKLNVPATCNPGGASGPGQQPKWKAEYSEFLRGADIVIVPDNDDPGRAHAETIAHLSAGIAKRVRILDLAQHWPDCPKGGDVSDWLAAGGSAERLVEMIDALPEVATTVDNASSAPLMLLTAIAIKLDSRGPVFFKQKRYGFNNELIEVYKFRSMYVDQCDATAIKLVQRGDTRVTRVGRFIRKTSLDELPQLINVVFKGNLSLVGPRPHAVHAKAENRLYDEAVDGYFARHRVKPGITGWAQISGWRGETDTQEKIQRRVEHDLYYIENWSVLFDLFILAKTPLALARTENAF
jgi:lipopolysaccharide/colanic/teichoic acid biosynthesis glycosyltransferase